MDTARQHRKRATQEYLEEKSGERTWTAGFRYSWRRMEAAAQDRAGDRCSTGSEQ